MCVSVECVTCKYVNSSLSWRNKCKINKNKWNDFSVASDQRLLFQRAKAMETLQWTYTQISRCALQNRPELLGDRIPQGCMGTIKDSLSSSYTLSGLIEGLHPH